MTIPIQRRAPAVDFVPAELHGELVIVVACCYSGDVEEGEKVLAPLKAFGSPVLDLCEPKPYLAHQSTFDAAFLHGWHYYFRACDIAELTDGVIDVMLEYGSQIPSPISSVALWQMEAPSRASATPTQPSAAAMPDSPSTSTATARPRKDSMPRASGPAPIGARSSRTTPAST